MINGSVHSKDENANLSSFGTVVLLIRWSLEKIRACYDASPFEFVLLSAVYKSSLNCQCQESSLICTKKGMIFSRLKERIACQET